MSTCWLQDLGLLLRMGPSTGILFLVDGVVGFSGYAVWRADVIPTTPKP